MRQYRKYALLVLCAGAFAAGITGCKKKENGMDRIKNAGELKVALYKQDTESETLCRRVADAIGVSLSYTQASSQEEALSLVNSGAADMAIGQIVETQPLEDGLSKSEPYLLQDWYVVTARGDYSDSTAGFKGRILALSHEVPDEGFRWSQDVGNVSFVGVQADKAASALAQDAMDGYVCLEPEAVQITESSPKVQMQRLYGVAPLGYTAAIRASDREFGTLVDGEISRMQNPEPETVEETTEAEK